MQLPRRRAAAARRDERPARPARRHRRAREPPAQRDPARRSSPRSTSTRSATSSATTRPARSSSCASSPRCSRRPGSSSSARAGIELTPKGIRAHRPASALGDLFRKLLQDRAGRHEIERDRRSATSAPTSTSRTSSATRSTSTSSETVKNAIRRGGCGHAGAALARRLRDRAHRAAHAHGDRAACSTCRSRWRCATTSSPAKKVAMALHALITTQFPRDYLGIVSLRPRRPRGEARAAARGDLGLRVGHQHAARAAARPQACSPARRGTQADHHDHRRRADRPHRGRRALLRLPAAPAHDRDDAARGAALHAGRHPHQHLHARGQLLPAQSSSSG